MWPWRDGPRAAQNLDPGHEVELLLSRVALPHVFPLDFDDLPIPFRAVATDLEGAAVAELGSGSLASALRATMSIPGVFNPVEPDGRLGYPARGCGGRRWRGPRSRR